MRRCITCGQSIDIGDSGDIIQLNGSSFVACCPVCEREFKRAPEHYLAVWQAALRNDMIDAEFQPLLKNQSQGNEYNLHPASIHLLQNLNNAFAAIASSYKELIRNFDQISSSGGLEGLRNSLSEHRKMLASLRDQIEVHAGVCRLVLAVADPGSPASRPARDEGGEGAHLSSRTRIA